MSEIASLVRHLAGRGVTTLKLCEVTSVDTKARTIDCQPLDETAPILDCSLQADREGAEGLTLYPKVGSLVVVGLVDGSVSGVALLADELDTLELRIGKMSLSVSADGITINDGTLGGLVKVETLVSQLNTLQREVNSLKRAFSTWVPSLGDGGTALKGAVTSWASKPVQLTQRPDIEDDKIKH